MKNHKRFLTLSMVLLMALTLIPATALAESDAIRIMLNGEPLYTDVAPYIDGNNRTMVPVRFISEALSADVKWDGPTGTATITRGATEIILRIGSRELSRNGYITMMDTEAVIIDSRTFVPLRFIAEALWLNVDWRSETRTVLLDTGGTLVFSTVFGYGGNVYSIYAAPEMPNYTGLTGSDKLTPLPASIGEFLEPMDMYVSNFAIYRDTIFYLAAEAGSDIVSGSIFECNLDGSGNSAVVSVVNPYATYVISENYLHFISPTIWGDHSFTLDLSGAGMTPAEHLEDFSMYTEQNVIFYDGFHYYFDGNTLYKKEVKTSQTPVVTTITPGPRNYYGNPAVIAVVYDSVYYITVGIKDASAGAYLFRVGIDGGESEFLASWYLA